MTRFDAPRGFAGRPRCATRRSHAARHRGTGLVRTLVVGSATLAILLVCFSIYQASQVEPVAADPRPAAPRLPSLTPQAPGTVEEVAPASAPGVSVGRSVVGPGRDIKLSLYPREGARARLEIAVQSWQPTGQESDEFLLVDPEVRMRTNDGRAVRVTAREGVLEAQRRPGGGLEPKRGQLTGNVVIEIDRLTERDRAELPPESRDVLDPAQLVRVELERIEFDLEYSKVVVPAGEVHLTARDIDFRAADLEIRFNEDAGRVEYFSTNQGGRIELRDLGGELALSVPGTEPQPARRTALVDWLRSAVEASTAAQQATADRSPTSVPDTGEAPARRGPDVRTAPDGSTIIQTDAREPPAPRPAVRYFARFEKDVVARQQVGDITKSLLRADILEILRELSQEDRQRARGAPPGSTPPSPPAAPPPPPERIVLEWAGRLLVEACTPDDARCVAGLHSQVTARGTPVLVTGTEGEATCAELRYQPEGSTVWLESSGATTVLVRSAEQGSISGAKLFSQQTGDDLLVRVDGPGRLERPRGDGAADAGDSSPSVASEVRFSDRLEVLGRFETRTQLDLSGSITTQRRRVLQRAGFEGNVTMSEGDTRMQADTVALLFAAPRGNRGGEPSVERVEARGHVVMSEGDDRVSCGELDLTLAAEREGRTLPQTAEARGDVEVVQQNRTIRAAEKLIIDFEAVERPPPPFNAAKAYQAAVRQGVDPKTIDWTAKRREYESRRRTEAGVKRLQAWGRVVIVDPTQPLDVSADRLDCALTDGREIKNALVVGSEEHPATVQLNSFTVTGREIKLDVPDEWAEVPGAGRLTFHSRKDLDGRRLDQPIPIVITWQEWMKYQGRENRSVFTGGVHATSSTTTTFDCAQLLVEFDDAAAPVAAPAAGEDWWIFQDLANRVTRPGGDSGRGGVGQRFGKEPAYILATGKAVVETAELHAGTAALETRARISGPKLSLNLRKEVSKMLIEGPGSLLLEDFREAPPREPPAEGKADGSGSRGPAGVGLFGVDQSAGPSKTLIEWLDLMWYDFSLEQTRFEGQVGLKHFSGAELQRLFGTTGTSGVEPPPGRSTFLRSDVLTVDFQESDDRTPRRGDRRMGRLSAEKLRQFRAIGNVTLQDQSEGLALTSHDLTYQRERSLLIVQGSAERKAHIVIQRPGEFPRDVTVERFFYNLKTKAVEVSKPEMKGR